MGSPPTRSEQHIDRLLQEALNFKNQGDHQRAVRVLSSAARHYPDSAPIRGLLGAILFSYLKKPAKALPHLQRATQLAPKSELASLGLFHSLWNLGSYADAVREMERFQNVSHCQDYDEILDEIEEKWLSPQARPARRTSGRKAR